MMKKRKQQDEYVGGIQWIGMQREIEKKIMMMMMWKKKTSEW